MTSGRDDDEPSSGDDRAPEASGRGRFALVLVTLVGGWNVYQALVASSSREAIPPTLFVAGAVGLGTAAVGPERFKVVAFFVGAALCMIAFVTAL